MIIFQKILTLKVYFINIIISAEYLNCCGRLFERSMISTRDKTTESISSNRKLHEDESLYKIRNYKLTNQHRSQKI